MKHLFSMFVVVLSWSPLALASELEGRHLLQARDSNGHTSEVSLFVSEGRVTRHAEGSAGSWSWSSTEVEALGYGRWRVTYRVAGARHAQGAAGALELGPASSAPGPGNTFQAFYQLQGRLGLQETVFNRTRVAPHDRWAWIRARGEVDSMDLRDMRGIGWFFYGTAKQPHLDEPKPGWFSPSTFRGLMNNYGRDRRDHMGYSVVQHGHEATNRVVEEVTSHIRDLYLRKWRLASPDYRSDPPTLEVDLFGFSRGAVTALAVANRLADPHSFSHDGRHVVVRIRVRYLYLLEPCATDSHIDQRARLCRDYALHEVIPTYEGVPVTGLVETAGGRDAMNGGAFPLVDLVGYLEQEEQDFRYRELRGGTRTLPRLPARLNASSTGFYLSPRRTDQGHNGVSNWFEVGGERGLRLLDHARAVGVPFDPRATFGDGGTRANRETRAGFSFHREICATIHELGSSYKDGRLPGGRRPRIVSLDRSRLAHR